MLETGAYLGASLFFGLIVLYFYRFYQKSKQTKPQQVAVPLRVDRSLLLAEQRRTVSERRDKLKPTIIVDPQKSTEPKKEDKHTDTPTDEFEDGFGEDLGVALTLSQQQSPPELTKRNRSTGRSRFDALKDAADQFRDMYNRNNQL